MMCDDKSTSLGGERGREWWTSCAVIVTLREMQSREKMEILIPALESSTMTMG